MENNEKNSNLRQPIVTVVGHVDHGKTSILDRFRGSSIQTGESGGITQKISFTKFPLSRMKEACPLIEQSGINIDIPGFLFIDTPGHAAFTNLRKRGGSLADLAILVVSVKDGIKPQTAEVLQILKAYKTPFLIALNKIDSVSGWHTNTEKGLKNSIESQAVNVQQEFQEALLTFQGSLSEHGFESDLFYEISDFTKKIAIVPCSAKTGEGISELLFVLSGLSQRFLRERLKLSSEAKGVVLEVKKERIGGDRVESILYDGTLRAGDEIAVASFGEPIVTKVRAIEEIRDLSLQYNSVESAKAATGLRIHLTEKVGVLSGMPFQKVSGDFESIKESFKKEVASSLNLDPEGIVVKADSLGSLEALLFLLRQENIKVVKAGIGPIRKSDVISAEASKENNPMDSVLIGFNSELEEGVEAGSIKVISNDVVYRLIEDLKIWRAEKQAEVEREKLMGLASLCKLEIFHQYVFRNSNPAIFGVKVSGGKAKTGINLIDNLGESVGRIKGIQHEKENVSEAVEGSEVAVSIPGIAFDRRLKDVNSLYSDISEKQFKDFKKNKDLLSAAELKVLQEIADIKRRTKEDWGV